MSVNNCFQSHNSKENGKSWDEEWDIMKLFNTKKSEVSSYCIIVLNRPISHNSRFLVNMWKNAKVTLTADGGTDRWDAFLQTLDDDGRALRPPHLVTGDFDSILPTTLEKYRQRGSKIIRTPDQDATDFTKAINEMNKHCQANNIHVDSIVVISENSGRMDHILANINTLFLCRQNGPKVFLMSNDSISWLLDAGEHRILIPETLRSGKNWCALIPIGQECYSVSTKGLKWNLDNKPLRFGGLVSTSNTYDGSSTVTVGCSHPLFWSMKTLPLFVECACS